MDIENLQRQLLQVAARFANQATKLNGDLPPSVRYAGDIFREDNARSGDSYLTLTFEPSVLNGVPPGDRDRVQTKLREIGKSGLRQALTSPEGKPILTALILGSAKQGENYFDRFRLR